jgi:hypothetical protein
VLVESEFCSREREGARLVGVPGAVVDVVDLDCEGAGCCHQYEEGEDADGHYK